MTAQEVIIAAMRKIAAVASGETPTANELADGLTGLQSMLRAWAVRKIVVYASVKDAFTLVSGTSIYTWGSGGTFNSVRPHKVTGAYINDSAGTSHPVDIISEGQYRGISVKATSSRPYALYVNFLYPLAYAYLYPTPDAAETLNTDSLKAFTETSSFSALSDTLAFPSSYEEAIIYNLAVRLAPEFGKAIPAEVAVIASTSYDGLTNLNASNMVEPVAVIVPAGTGFGRYNINSDTYR